MVLVPKYSEKAPSVRMNVPQENSPIVSAPTTRSGGGSRVLMSATCAVTCLWRKARTCRLRSATSICEGAGGFCANELPLTTSNPQRIEAICRAQYNLILRARERAASRVRIDELAHVTVSPNGWNSPHVCAAPATAGLPASSTVRRSTSHHWGGGCCHGATPPAALDPCLRRGSNTGRSAIVRFVLPLPDNPWRVHSRWLQGKDGTTHQR